VEQPDSQSVKYRLCEEANIPPKYWDVRFKDFETHNLPSKVAAGLVKDYMIGLEEELGRGRGITFWGSVGTGKTMLASLIAVHCLRKRCGVRFYREDDIFDSFKAKWNEPAEEHRFLTVLQKVRCLIIDDFGVRKPTDYTSERYQAIFNARYESQRSTIITTNVAQGKLDDAYLRVMDRLSEMNTSIEMIFPSYRRKND